VTDRKVKVSLEVGTSGAIPPLNAVSAAALKLELSLKQEAATAKKAAVETVKAAQQIAIAEKQAALAATEAAARMVEGDEAQAAAQKAVSLASKELVAQQKVAAKEVAAAEREAATAGKEVVVTQKAIEDQSKKTSEAYTNSGKRMMVAGAALLGVFALAEKATTSFDTAMSGVGAVANATAVQLGQLRTAALAAGRDTAYTATEAADAEGELVKAGVSVTDVLNGGLKGALSLAAAGQLSLADSATISANAMNVFGLKGADVGHIADVLAAGANKSAAGVQSLGAGLGQAGLVAAQAGLKLEDTTAVLAAFADRGLEGVDAGTSMKTMLERLTAPTGAAADAMKTLGINAYDSSGKFAGIVSVAGQLHDKLGALSEAQRNQALSTIFGSDAIRGATVLYNLGAQGMQGYIDSVNDSGAAGRMAAMQMNNLSGDLKQLRGSIDTALIQGGSAGNDALRSLTQSATGAVNAFAALPRPLQEVAVGLAGGGGASLLLVGGLTTAAGKVGTMRKALAEMEETATGARGALAKVGTFMTGPWGLAIAGATAVLGIFASSQHKATIEVADFSDALKEDGDALGQHTAAAIAASLSSQKVYDIFTKAGISMDTVTQAAMGNAAAMKILQDATDAAGASTSKIMGRGQAAPNNPQADAMRANLDIIKATANGLHDQQHAQLQATAAQQAAASSATDDASVQARLAQAAKEYATGLMQRTAASRAAAQAAEADASGTKDATGAVKGATSATKVNETATKAKTAAQKAAATAAKDAAKASSADAKASVAAANAADQGSYANSTAAGAAKSASEATKDKTRAQNADATASNAAARAAKAAAKAHGEDARAAASHAQAASADAEASREAALTHQLGIEALKGWAAAAADTSHTTDTLSDSVTAEVAAMKDAQAAASGLKDGLDALDGVHISAGRAAVDVQNKIADLTKTLHENGKTLDITTQAGRDNTSAIYDAADAILQHAQAVTQETGSVWAGNKALEASRTEFDKVLKQAGLTTDEIQNFNDTLLAIPPTVGVTIDVNTVKALAELKQFKDAAGNLTAIHIGGTTGRAGLATGGRVVGAGTTTSDSIPTNLSRDEYVIKASAAARIGYAELDRLNFGGGVPTMVRPQYVAAVGGTTAHHAAAAATVSAPQLVLMPGADSAVATMINKLINTGQLVIKR